MKRYTITEDQRRDAIEYADALIEADQGGSPKDMAYRAGIVRFIDNLRATPEATQAPVVPVAHDTAVARGHRGRDSQRPRRGSEGPSLPVIFLGGEA